MPLHVEILCDNIITYLQANLPGQIATVLGEGGPSTPPLGVPRNEDYFLGEQSRYRAYRAPAVFVIAQTSVRPNEGESNEWDNVLFQHHRVLIDLLVEGPGEEVLTRAAQRMAQAVDNTLHDADVTPDGIAGRATKVFVPRISYDSIFVTPDQRTFRKDIWVELLVKHWDSLLPRPFQTIVGTKVSQLVASVVDTLLATADPTTIFSYVPGPDTANYELHIYYRVTVATTLLITVTWQDGTAAQTLMPVSGSQGVNSYSVASLYLTAIGGQPIAVTATAGAGNAVYLSATLEKVS